MIASQKFLATIMIVTEYETMFQIAMQQGNQLPDFYKKLMMGSLQCY